VYIKTQFFDSKAPYKEGAMYAIVEIAGKQYKVNTEETITVPTLEKQPGDKVTFDKVLLVGDDNTTRVGTPHVAGSVVEGTVVDHPAADKVIVFKKKKRKGYRVKRGHRQEHTRVQITSIGS
jgi:large subunit ribosomal protein L21